MRVNRRVSIWKHVRLADGKWRYCRPVLDAKDKIVPDLVMVKGGAERHGAEEGSVGGQQRRRRSYSGANHSHRSA